VEIVEPIDRAISQNSTAWICCGFLG